MSSGATSCRQCGCSEIDTDAARGDAVCTNCGFVLEESLIVSEVTFEEDGHGGASAVGQFVSAESRGGGGAGLTSGSFHSAIGKESREITLRTAKRRIMDVAQHLRLNAHCVEVAYNFFKMALHKQMTKGRRHPLTIAACVYMTCRMEGTPHLLIDFSDVVQMDVYALGRAYLQLSRALYINIPAVDPCLYILRFSHKLNLGTRTHEVSVTALRLVQRMKRDWIHFGRRPSGLCGAALLIAARLHGFSRSVQDIVNVVKVHETTLRRRLIEFGETPSSSLTMDEFMTVDLEEEHDPPAFKAARVKDREHLQKMMESGIVNEFDDLQAKIESELEKRTTKKKAYSKKALKCTESDAEVEKEVIYEITRSAIQEMIPNEVKKVPPKLDLVRPSTKKSEPRLKKELKTESHSQSEECELDPDRLLMPPPCQPLGMQDFDLESNSNSLIEGENENDDDGVLDLTGIDESEIEGYLMTNQEVERKKRLWEMLNNDYIVNQEKKKVQLEQDIKDGKLDLKKKVKKEKGANKDKFHAKTAGEAIKIMLEKKLSSKINYEVLKSLSSSTPNQESESPSTTDDPFITVIESGPVIPKRNMKEEASSKSGPSPRKRFKSESESIENLKASTSVVIGIDPDTKSIVLKPIKADLDKSSQRSMTPAVLDLEEPPEEEYEETEEIIEETEELEVVEESSGPYDEVDENQIENEQADIEEDDYEEDEEEEDETGLSASELLSQFRGETEKYY